MSQLPIDPDANGSSGAGMPCSNCDHGRDRPRCQTSHNCQANGRTQKGEAVVTTISLCGHAGQIATSPDGNHLYVIVADSVKVISRLHHVVGSYHIGPHPKSLIVSADGTRVYVTGYDGSTSVITTADNTVKTFMLERSNAEVVSPDGDYIYTAHSGIVGDTGGSWISVVSAEGATVAVVPVDRHATDMALSPDGRRLYVASGRGSSYLDSRGVISVIRYAHLQRRRQDCGGVGAGQHDDEPQWHQAVCHPLPQECNVNHRPWNRRREPMGVR
jgi:DNA-binding beta-propeller fold protein YncE